MGNFMSGPPNKCQNCNEIATIKEVYRYTKNVVSIEYKSSSTKLQSIIMEDKTHYQIVDKCKQFDRSVQIGGRIDSVIYEDDDIRKCNWKNYAISMFCEKCWNDSPSISKGVIPPDIWEIEIQENLEGFRMK